jgi:hypothetical protein
MMNIGGEAGKRGGILECTDLRGKGVQLRDAPSPLPRFPAYYGTSSDLGSTFTIQSPELMSGT